MPSNYGHRVTTQDIQKMQDLRASGMSTSEICRQTGFADKTVYKYCGTDSNMKKYGKRMTDEEITKMRALRGKGLSNMQIAVELGISYETVARHLGKQKKGLRADYGSIVTHAQDAMPGFMPCSRKTELEQLQEHADDMVPGWMKEALAEKKPEPAKPAEDKKGLSMSRNVTEYAGKKLLYKVDSEGTILIKEAASPLNCIQLSFKEFDGMLEELMELIDKIPQK